MTHSSARENPLRVARAALVLVTILALTGAARADGTVLSIEGDSVYVDLGARDGVGSGTKLLLMHLVKARDPVTGELLSDRFPLGRLEVIKAGEHLCLARVPVKLRKRVKVGDGITIASKRRHYVDPWREQVERSQHRVAKPVTKPVTKPRPGDDRAAAHRRASARVAAAEVVRAAWNKTLGRDPAARIAIWTEFLGHHPDNPFADNVRAEIASLQKQQVDEKRAAHRQRDPELRRAQLRVARLVALEPGLDTDGPLIVRAPRRIYQGQSIDLAFTVLAPQRVDRAWLYYRRGGDDTYQRLPLVANGDAYLRGTIAADVVAPPHVEYFVDVATGTRDPVAALGSADAPRRITVEDTVEETAPDITNRSRVTVLVDYVDFDGGFTKGFDQYSHAEIDFMYRFYRPIYAMRVGFGNLQGMGGPKDVIDEDPHNTCRDPGSGLYMCQRVAYSYAYTELELRASKHIAFMIRPQFGTGYRDSRAGADPGRCTGADTDDCDLFSSLGLRARVRFGEETSTNLTLGFAVTEKVGTVFEATYTWSVIPEFPVLLSAQVTDQPVPEDFGVRLIADVGWRALDWVYPSLRVSYQARDVDHSGFSGGVAANFDW